MIPSSSKALLNPGHSYATTTHISFTYHQQIISPAAFSYTYYLSLPPAYTEDSTRHWPLLLFLHGAGESQRTAGESYPALRHGVPKIVLCYDRWKSGKEPKVDIPQASKLKGRNPNKGVDFAADPVDVEVCKLVAEEFVTVTPVLDMTNGYGWNPTVLSALLDEILNTYSIDPSRVHVTGLSMGGYGTWSLALHRPETFASLLPICGGGDPLRVSLIKDIPQWVHHGEKDDIVPIEQSVKMVKALEKAKEKDEGRGAEIKFDRYEELAHGCWSEAYGRREVWEWVLAQRKGMQSETRPVEGSSEVVDVL
ncbi:alpha/beta-hydrolase [Atractiella rhizophila]|nr:alpha/beta-hydrolase [Atractiella rhizophila]